MKTIEEKQEKKIIVIEDAEKNIKIFLNNVKYLMKSTVKGLVKREILEVIMLIRLIMLNHITKVNTVMTMILVNMKNQELVLN